MKTKLFILLMAFVAFGIFTSCDKITQISFTYSTADVTFNYGPDSTLGVVTLADEQILNPIDSVVKANKGDLSQLKSVYLKKCTLTITDSDSSNFNAISEAHASLKTDLLPSLEIASISSVPPNVKSIDLGFTKTDLTSYIKSSKFDYILTATLVKPVPKKLTIKVHLDFDVTAGAL